VFRLGRRTPAQLEDLLERARASQLTYASVGATRDGVLPQGFHHDRAQLRLGDGSSFGRAREGLLRWQAHIGAGARVHPADPPAEGATVLVTIALGPLQAIVPCRVLYVDDEPDRFAFAYGTLPGHPERGEEAFAVERDGGDTVFRIVAFSRPADLLTRLGSPVPRRVQRHFTRRYLRALAAYSDPR
jgi:uncharacterized protein (UPF0548 family)